MEYVGGNRMSDFIYTSQPAEFGTLSAAVGSIYSQDKPKIVELHGAWGSLAVSRNLYRGLDYLENRRHICIIVGGPVLYFRNNDFLTGSSDTEGTTAICDRINSGSMRWDEDLSGPFALLFIDKRTQRVSCVTDLMSFIPVFSYAENGGIMLSTHAAVLAEVSGQSRRIDQISVADFILNSIVTFPYTVYQDVFQLKPASVFSWTAENGKMTGGEERAYWLPSEKNPYSSLRTSASYLRKGVQGYVDRITDKMSSAAQFITGGEDSRVIAGLLPPNLRRDGYIFLDSMNREGQRAQKAAETYDLNYFPQLRDKFHYINILKDASDLVGCGFQYIHAHTLHFHSQLKLQDYSAVFGGYVSDILIKAHFSRKFYYIWRLHWLPDFFMKGETRTVPLSSSLFFPHVLREIDVRRRKHYELVKSFRPLTAHEWFELWPITMHLGISNFYNNRRLFRTYEPFMCKESVKVSAAAPPRWKLNRRLFLSAFRPYLHKSRWLLHADGRLPYFPWWVNLFIQTGVLQFRKAAGKLGYTAGNQGPWGDWKAVMESDRWKQLTRQFEREYAVFEGAAAPEVLKKGLNEGLMSTMERLNLLQCLYSLGGNFNPETEVHSPSDTNAYG
jgi:hypothetical protein